MKKYIYTIFIFIIFQVVALYSQVDCFLEDFESKYTTIPVSEDAEKPAGDAAITITINGKDTVCKVSKYIYGNNANPYMSQMVDQPDLINYLNILSPNIIRFPGGNLSSIYFWNSNPNNPPADAPDSLVDGNTGKKSKSSFWYGKNTSSWTISVDNYYNMLDMTGSTGMITINYGYARYGTGPDPVAAAAHLAADWVRYDNGRTMFWEIGNESYGSWQAGYMIDVNENLDGQPKIQTGELYGKHFLVFADSMRKAAREIGSTIYIGAQMYEMSTGSSTQTAWDKGFFKQAGDAADFFIVHSYFTNYNENSTAATILNSATTMSVNIMNYLKQVTTQNSVNLKPVALTEWNIFAIGSKQACSFVNGMHAALVLGELIKNGYTMSSRWDLANGYDNGNDHGIFSAGDEQGVPKWNPRPAFFYMYYFQKIFGDHMVSSIVTGSKDVLCYASKFTSGQEGIVVVNKTKTDLVVKIVPKDFGFGDKFYIYSLIGGSDNGDFSQSVNVNGNGPTNLNGGPIDGLSEIPAYAYSTTDEIKFNSPARSVQYIMIEPGNNVVSVDRGSDNEKLNTFKLNQNYPNPFNPSTVISYQLPVNSEVKLKLFDVLGNLITTLVDKEQSAGFYNYTFSTDNYKLSSGVYFFQLETSNQILRRKCIYLK
jgi:alpha-L-arabinofuranosidase